MTENPSKDDDDRVHSQAPAEGEPSADPSDLRVHAQDPAEGADDDKDAGKE